ncbi:MAG: helix-turn-helix transcriptional regulator [bacterium]|uniref:Helix-turn-helix transcriptional regulator n=1 Tax=Candidatus Aphodosoma intestinipullorum TaxID=2840674 RepID=A0A940DIF9_9BACT|nr:helix-turn-helix transcriptional regulator [Candidatus Aphodosoma intestinipullorum]
MVCPRCIMAVRKVLSDAGVEPLSVELGRATVEGILPTDAMSRISAGLDALGFSLIEDRRTAEAEMIKTAVIEFIHCPGQPQKQPLSSYLAATLHREYSHLSKLFSETTGTTIEQYFIAQKVERVKELIEYGDMTMSEIADRLGYSSTAHLSAQFKKHTGMTPSEYRSHQTPRTPIDRL